MKFQKLFLTGSMMMALTSSALGATTMPNISSKANRYPTGGRSSSSIPLNVKVICFSGTVCPLDPYTGTAITKASMTNTLNTLRTKYFTSGGQTFAKFTVNQFEKVIDPDYYNPTTSDFLGELTAKYGVTGAINVFIVNDAAYGGLGYVDQDIGSPWASVVVMHHGANAAKSHILAHELTHTMGGNHAMDDWGGSNEYKHPECGSDFVTPVQLMTSGNFEIVTSAGCNAGNFKYNNLMSYAADWTCGKTPTLFTDQWFYDAQSRGYSKNGVDFLPAHYGNAYRVAMKCWNYRNF